jgi:hypothetical protein
MCRARRSFQDVRRKAPVSRGVRKMSVRMPDSVVNGVPGVTVLRGVNGQSTQMA